MTTRILINGAHGKMGQATVNAFKNLPEFLIVGETGRTHSLAEEIKKTQPDIVIELTHAAVVFQNTQTIISAGVHPVIGASGLVKEQIDLLQKQCAEQQLGGIIAPNFSIAAILMMKCAKEIVKYFPAVEIIETHHAGKLDSPSGTAIKTAEMLAEARLQKPNALQNTRDIIPGARGAIHQDIPIHSLRLPGVVAQQEVIFGGLGETLTIRHETIDRQCFMPGVILSCQKVRQLTRLVYGLEHLLD